MVSGSVNSVYQPLITVVVRGPQGQQQTVVAIVDTGFNGTLLLPPAIVAALGLPFHSSRTVLLADGSLQAVGNSRGRVVWEGAERSIRIVAAGNQPLVGMRLLAGQRLGMDIVLGGDVTVEPPP